MSFSFGFSNDDIESDLQTNDFASTEQHFNVNPLDDSRLLASEVIQPQYEELNTLLQSLKDVRLSFEEFLTPQQTVLFRRELFDVKHQLMSESEDLATDKSINVDQNVELEILIGETAEDVRKNVYEGGLKSWECSIDLVDSIVIQNTDNQLNNYDFIVELGCGSALPSDYIFRWYLQNLLDRGVTMVLSDYNRSVLRLVTLPNLIITWAKTVLNEEQWESLQKTSEDDEIPIHGNELLLSAKLLEAFALDLQLKNIQIKFISGSWGRKFNNLIKSNASPVKGMLLLTSETIYQPENLPVVGETILDLKLHYNNFLNHQNVVSLIAAKDIYFGVGGSVIEFENYINHRLEELCKKGEINFATFRMKDYMKRSITRLA